MFDTKGLLRGARAAVSAGFFNGFQVKDGITTARSLVRYGASLSGLLEVAAARFPDRVALVDDDGELTYAELRDQAVLTAQALVANGVGADSKVGIMARNGRGFLIPLAAKGYVGFTVFLLNVGASRTQIASIVDDHDISFLFVDSEFDDRVPDESSAVSICHSWIGDGARKDIAFPSFRDLWATPATTDVTFGRRPRQGGVVLMSSGTSGTPKAVGHGEPHVPLGVLGPPVETCGLQAGCTLQMTASMFHVLGWGASCIALFAGCTIVTQRNFNAENVLHQLDRYRCDGLISSAVFLKDQLAVHESDPGSYDTSSLTFILNAGNAMSEDLVRGLQERYGYILGSGYGSTEGLLVSYSSPSDLREDPLTAGHPVWNGRLELLDTDSGREVGAGQVGVVHARNAMSMKGYLGTRDREDATRGLLSLGDKGVIDPQTGRLRVLGRNNDMIIVGGENIWPTSVSDIIDRVDGVAESYCVGVEDDEKFQRVKAYVVTDGSADLSEDDIRTHVRENFMAPAIPRDVVLMDQPLPRNPIGKVVKRELEAFG
ncbi:Acyl-CoA synthetase [Corynebacterium glyciniphilum AJ 3170]|uniref:Acyl-CoA synthetase n=1 Tax=Corynebacterium glyciniphilum AJ 3170 TaxID=1404245 RepID=X5E794_9CORY|nr:AMP-binding protein [Corynebacterium glyciniphilum]AHW62556.1 Acyl-CoA synthetase [Corynebacterium glyciniphilum AJ 3170]